MQAQAVLLTAFSLRRHRSRASAGRGTLPPARTGAIILAVAAGCAATIGWAGAECIDYEDYLHWVTSVDTPGFARGVAVSGAYAYVADDDCGLQVIDISNPQSPQIVGSVDTPDLASEVAVSGVGVPPPGRLRCCALCSS